MSSLPLVKGFYFSDLVLTWIGIYCIYNKYHDYYYIGFSLDLADRFVAHRIDLDKDRHKNKLLQNHYNEIINQNLNPINWIEIYPIYKWFIEYAFPIEIQQELVSRLKNLENHLIRIFNEKYKVYNVDQTARSNHLIYFVSDFTDKKSTQEIEKTENFLEIKIKNPDNHKTKKDRPVPSLGKCVEIYNVGVYPNIKEAWKALSQIATFNLSTFRNYLNENRYTDIFGFITEKEYFLKKGISFNTVTSLLFSTSSKNIPKWVEIFEPINEVYPSVASAAFILKIDPVRLLRNLNAKKFPNKYRFISQED